MAEERNLADQPKPADDLINPGKPNDPAKKENPDTRLDQLKPGDKKKVPEKDDTDPALETTRKAGQGGG